MSVSIRISDAAYRQLTHAAQESRVPAEQLAEEAVDSLVSQLEYEKLVDWEAIEASKDYASDEEVAAVFNNAKRWRKSDG